MDPVQDTSVSSNLGFTCTGSSTEKGPRRGQLSSGSRSLQTPALFVHSRHGSPQNLTPDLVAKLDELKAVHINAKDFVVQGEVLAQYGQGGHKFLVLENQMLCLAYNDPAEFDATPVHGKALNMSDTGGKRKIDAAGWIRLQTALRAEIYTAMSFDVQFYSGNKKHAKCVEATLAWLDELLPPHADNKKSAYGNGQTQCPGALFAVIQGGNNEFERRKCIKTIVGGLDRYAPAKPIQGFVLGGFGLDEMPEDRTKHVELTVSLLPAQYPRLLPLVESPEDVLEAVNQGIDLFSNSYPGRVADLGHAFTFAISNFEEAVSVSTVPTAMGGDRNRINLKDPVYELDQRPILPSCPCYTCSKHTRAYIHHLINTHEMLSTILLTIHNTHHYLAFFAAIRSAIDDSSFETYRKHFVECYRRPL